MEKQKQKQKLAYPNQALASQSGPHVHKFPHKQQASELLIKISRAIIIIIIFRNYCSIK